MEQLELRGITLCLVKATLAAGTTTTYSTTGTTVYSIQGKAYSKAAVTNGATPTTDVNTGNAFVPVKPNEGSVFVFCYDASGTVRVAQGGVKGLDAGGGFVEAPDFPAIPETVCPFAYLIIQAGASASNWTFGTSNQSGATGVTYTRQDVITLPARPQLP